MPTRFDASGQTDRLRRSQMFIVEQTPPKMDIVVRSDGVAPYHDKIKRDDHEL